MEPSDTLQSQIQQKHNAVRQYLENNLQTVDTKLIGSVARKTRIHPRPNDTFDIDILVILGSFNRWVAVGGITPAAALEMVRSPLASSPRYQTMRPTTDAPTVLFEHSDDIKIELVPAYRDLIGYSPSGISHTPAGRGYWIPDGANWKLADYDHESDQVVLLNRTSANWLVPMIKVLKALRRQYFPNLKPFHLEILATRTIPGTVNFLRTRNTPVTYPGLLIHFFGLSRDMLGQPAVIPGSNSTPLMMNPTVAQQVAGIFDQLQSLCTQIISLPNANDRLRAWRNLFGEPFPAT